VGYRCVACRATLTAETPSSVGCLACGRAYPMLLDRVPVLVDEPLAHVARTIGSLERLIGEQRGKVEHLDMLLARGTERDAALTLLRTALIENSRFLLARRAELVGLLPQGMAQPQVMSSRPDPNLGYLVDVFDYLRQDWSTTADGREDVETIIAALRAGIRACAPAPRHAVFIGAGLARFAAELRDEVECLIALDLSLMMALTHLALRDGEVRVFEINERIAYDLGGLARTITASAKGSAPIDYCVADARQMPFSDASQDLVVSAFFTDVVPLSALLREVRRVLVPGGSFIHFGPLGYHFYAPEEMWTVEEARQVFARHGFELGHEAWVPVWLHRSSARMSNTRIDAWSFRAVAR